jgi:hypothetical protein
MNRSAIKDILYGGLLELSNNKRYFYTSALKGYSHWTEEGNQQVLKLLELITPMIYEAEEKELEQRAKDLVLKDLKS